MISRAAPPPDCPALPRHALRQALSIGPVTIFGHQAKGFSRLRIARDVGQFCRRRRIDRYNPYNRDDRRLSALSQIHSYEFNFDSDGDGINDSIKASFALTPPASGASYGIFEIRHGEYYGIAGVEDYSGYPRRLHYGSSGFDTPTAFLGSQHRDTVGADDLDYVNGNDGADVIVGGPRNQTLLGGAGSDHLSGLAGDDALDGGLGRDTLTGGTGADVFVVAPGTLDRRDTVTDFSQGQNDRVDLSAFAGLHFVDRFDGTSPEVRARTIGGDTALVFDLDGDGAVDARITFTGHVPLIPADVILPD